MGARPTLRGPTYAESYRTDADDLVQELFAPLLGRALRYRRAAGFFSSSVFEALGPAFATFFAVGGRMELVTSPRLGAPDLDAIATHYIARASDRIPSLDALCEALARRSIRASDAYGLMLRLGVLDHRIARPTTEVDRAIYHEKFALFSDAEDVVAISGSGNESKLALTASFERFELFRSWGRDHERLLARRMVSQFSALVRNQTSGLEVLSLLDAYQQGLLEKRMTADVEEIGNERIVAVQPAEPEVLVPFTFPLFDHQKKAIAEWAGAGGKGLLAMATGSGKTVTALSIASRLYDALETKRLAIVVVAPFIHLVDQWIEVAEQVGLRPIRCAESRQSWHDELATAIFALNAGSRRLLSIATTSATLQLSAFQEQLQRIRVPLLVIGDEAHNYGSRKIAGSLPDQAAYRIGLSATPEKWMDPEGTKRIHDYFGRTVHSYGLADALRDEVLTPYIYHPQLVTLDEAETDKYEDLTAKLVKFGISDETADLSEGAKALLLKRARILAGARSKLPVIEELLADRTHDTHMLIYCGDGRLEGDADEMPPRQIDEVVAIVERLGITSARYTAETSPEQRRAILRDFDEGRIQALVAIRCLDEGVDVPSTRTAFILSSSTNPRQFIQRRGRVLRRSPQTGKTRAEIYDFFVLPDTSDKGSGVSPAMRGVVKKQLDRVLEFSNLAINGPRARRELLEWTDAHGLMGLWGQ